MTLKIEDITKWVPFGFGMIGKVLDTDPATKDDPIIMFVHKQAAGGKFHNGEPILSPKEEKAMLKDVEALVALLSKFNVNDDFVKLPDDYNQPRAPRKAPDTKAAEQRLVEVPSEEPVKRPRGWNLRKGAKDAVPSAEDKEWEAAAPKPVEPVAEEPKRRGGRRKVETAAPVAAAEPEKRPRGWNLRKGAKDTKAKDEPAPAAPTPKPVTVAARRKAAPVAPEEAVKRGRGWNLRKGAKDTRAKEETRPLTPIERMVDEAVGRGVRKKAPPTQEPPLIESTPRRLVRRATGTVEAPETPVVAGKRVGGRRKVAEKA